LAESDEKEVIIAYDCFRLFHQEVRSFTYKRYT